MSPDELAERFSTHRFAEVFDHLHPDAVWVLPGSGMLRGRHAIREACEEAGAAHAEWLRVVMTGPGDVVAVDTIARYADEDGESVVSSCDVYEFDGDVISRITSYNVELAAPPAV